MDTFIILCLAFHSVSMAAFLVVIIVRSFPGKQKRKPLGGLGTVISGPKKYPIKPSKKEKLPIFEKLES